MLVYATGTLVGIFQAFLSFLQPLPLSLQIMMATEGKWSKNLPKNWSIIAPEGISPRRRNTEEAL